MSEIKHTPGPWYWDGGSEFDIIGRPTWPCSRFGIDGEWRIAQVDELEFDELSARGEAEANARLIAAAPDLLNALFAAERLFHHTFATNGTIHKQMIAAIARATGTATEARRS